MLYKPALFHLLLLSSYPTGSDTHKALVDRAKSPDAFWHHRIRVLHHLWNKNNEPLRFCFTVKRRQYKRGNLHWCHNRENKRHRQYLAQDSLCIFFSCHKPKVHRGSCQLPSPTQRRGSAVGQNPTVPGIIPMEREDGSHLHVLPNCCAALPSLSSHQHCFHPNKTTATTPRPTSLVPNTCWPEVSKIEHPSEINIPPVSTCEHREEKWLTRSYRASQNQQPESPGNSFLIYWLQSVPERDLTGRSKWWGWQSKI